MKESRCQWSVSNPGPEELLLWLEPWAEEFRVPIRSTVVMSSPAAGEAAPLGEVEWTPDHLVVWANQPGTLEVYINGALQASSSATVPIPASMTKPMLQVVFGNQPAARLAGRPYNASEQSLWQRVRQTLSFR